MPIALVVNGRAMQTESDAVTPLLHVLRNELDLRGSRFGCGLEQCGACMVLVDGEPVYACAREVGSVANKRVTTIEAFADDATLRALHRAFLDTQAGQCGYCLSGIIMSAKALIDRHPAPRREDIAAALDKHLCRCGAHNRIIHAVERAAAALRQEARG